MYIQSVLHLSATETDQLMLFGEAVAVYCENHGLNLERRIFNNILYEVDSTDIP
jgi:hypothetical protein